MKRSLEKIITSGVGLALLTFLGFAAQASSTSTISLTSSSLDLALFVLIYYLLHHQIAKLSQAEAIQDLITERQQAQAALADSEKRLRTIIEAQLECVQVLAVDGTIQEMNAAGLAMIEASDLQQVIGQPACSLVAPKHRDLLAALTRQACQGNPGTLQFEIVGLLGTHRWLESHAMPIHNEQNEITGILSIARDITAHKQAEEILRRSEEKLRLALEAAHMGTWDWNILTNQITCSSSHEQLFGLAPSFFGRTYEDFEACIHPEDREAIVQTVKRARLERHGYHQEFRVVWSNGSIHWIEGKGKFFYNEIGQAVRMVGTVMDISDRKHREEQLRLLESVVVNTNNAVLITEAGPIDQPCPRIFYVNPAFTRMTGYSPEEVIGQTPRILHGAKTDRVVCEQIRVALQTRQPIRIDLINYCKDGSKFWVDLSIVPVANEKGGTYWVWVQRDITERKLAEAALQKAKDELEIRVAARTSELSQAEAKYRSIFENAIEGIFQTTTDGQYLTANPMLARIYGYSSPKELIANISDIGRQIYVNANRRAEFIRLLKKHDTVSEFESQVYRQDGKVIWVSEQARAVRDSSGVLRYYEGTVEDITKRKQAEEERANLTAILEATSDIVATANVDQQLSYLNSAARKILGFGEDEDFANFTISNTHPDWAYEIIRNEGIPAAIRDGVWVGETAFLSHDGRSIPVSQLLIAHKSPDGSVKLLSTIARDITEQKQIEATLREAERRWRTLLENVRLLVVGLDRTGKVEYVNPFFLELVGYTQAEVVGKDWFKTFLPPHHRQQVRKSFLEQQKQEFHTHYQNVIVTKAGEERTIAWNNTLLQNLQGDLIGTMSIGEDITERQAIERMKDEFISVVSHELRTPLTSIHGALSLLSSGLINIQSDKGRRVIEIAAQSADRLVLLVNDILELERLESGKISLLKQPCNATDLMMKATDMLQVMANRAGITLSVSPHTIQLDADPDRIIQVLTNLLGNAIKFSPTGSTVWLTVELLRPCFSANPKQILFQVKDQGRGIPADKIESIFERFHQVDASDSRKKGGTGLGLAICRSIVQQHGGQIWVESTLGQGSSFYFTLPGWAVDDDNHDNQANLGD